jgi:hypothetical protein
MQRLVFALATDKAVWDAVMKNELVQILRQSLYTGLHSPHHMFGFC